MAIFCTQAYSYINITFHNSSRRTQMEESQHQRTTAQPSVLSLMEWESNLQRSIFPLLTIHSLTLDDNPKYIYLKQLIAEYNQDPEPERVRYRQAFIEKLFKMMSEVSRMEGIENQLQCLEKIYLWANNGKEESKDGGGYEDRRRPQTASSRTKVTRPTTAYSRPQITGTQAGNQITSNRPGTALLKPNEGIVSKNRPQTGVSRMDQFQAATISQEEEDPYYPSNQLQSALKFLQPGPPPENFPHPKRKQIDYSKLTYGQCEFYTGGRTLHPEFEHPRKRLKEFQRNRLYQQDEQLEDEQLEVIDLEQLDQREEEEAEAKKKVREMEVSEERLLREIEDAKIVDEGNEGGAEGDNLQNGLEAAENLQGDANVDDIPLQGEDEPLGEPQLEEQPVVIDKLRPRLKAYGQKQLKEMKHFQKKHYGAGLQEVRLTRNYKERNDQEDRVMVGLQAEWAQLKGRAKSQMKRRAQSARIITKKIGIPYQKDQKYSKGEQPVSRQNVINFQNIIPAEVQSKSSKLSRPVTALTSDRLRQREELIKNAFLTSNLKTHVALADPSTITGRDEGPSLAVWGQKPKKKTFEQILRQAQERVVRESQAQILDVKQCFSKNKISFGANRIAKSITHCQREVQQWQGAVTGMTMMKNPFIKVSKKKKKKKKKN